MISNALYEAAFKLRKIKLWQELYDTQLFAVGHSDGTTGYCCVMGALGEHLALAVYPGEEGLASYRKMSVDRSELSRLEEQEAALSQDCVTVSFENKDELRPKELGEARAYCAERRIVLRGSKAYPQFQRYRPHFFPWYIDDEKDQAHLSEALEACFLVAAKLKETSPEACGFTEGPPFNRSIPFLKKEKDGFTWGSIALPKPKPFAYPSPETENEIALTKLAKSGKRGGEWACDIFMHVTPMSNEAGEGDAVEEPEHAPFYPYLLLIVDNQTGLVLTVQPSSDPEDYSEAFVGAVLECARNNGRPSRILVSNERAEAFFRNLSAQLGVELTRQKDIPSLKETEEGFLEQFDQSEEGRGEDMDRLMEMLRDPQALAALPEVFLLQLSQMIDMGALPEDIVENIRRECSKRGLE
jgi:hypothetical protein